MIDYGQLFRFGVVGGTVTLTFMGLNHLIGRWCGKNLAFLLAYPPAVLLHFALNKWWTFEEQSQATAHQTGQYLLMTAVAFAIQWSMFQALTRWLKVRAWLASGVATVAQMSLAYLAMRLWVFAAR